MKNPPTPTTTPQPIAHWRCCLCHHTEHNAITRDLSRPAAHTTAPPFHPARCALCAQPPCARCLVARPAPRWDASSYTYTSPSRLIEWNPSRRDAWGFVCMHCGAPTLVSRARRFAHAAARTAWSKPTSSTTRGDDDDGGWMVLGPGATVSEEVAAGMVARGGQEGGGRQYEGFEMEFLPFQRRRKVGVGEMLGLVARCGNEACGQPMCDESLEFYVPVDDGDGEVSRWELADWICSAAEGTARWVNVAKLKGVAKGALGLGVMYYVLV